MTVLKFHVDFKAISFEIFLTYRLIKVQKTEAISEVQQSQVQKGNK